jgi:hypothetical protein
MYVSVRECCSLNNQIFEVTLFTLLTPLPLLSDTDPHSQLSVRKHPFSPILH